MKVENIIPRNIIIKLGCALVDNHIRRDDIFDYHLRRECNIYIIPGSRLLISSLPGSALRTHVESLGKPRDVNKHSQAVSKPCLINLISKDTHLVFSISGVIRGI